MLKTVEGVFRDGRVELLEPPAEEEGARVLVTFLSNPSPVSLSSLGVGREEAAELRWRLGVITEDWDDPAMDVYDEP